MNTNYTTVEIQGLLSKEDLAKGVVELWDRWRNQTVGWRDEKQELHNYLFATDTSHTIAEEGNDSAWNNRTTVPKLTQLRDNLTANYSASLFPNDSWLRWEGYNLADDTKAKKDAIQAYMSNKVRIGGFVSEMKKCINDYVDYGCAFTDVIWVNEMTTDPKTGEKVGGYKGPKAIRISPEDHVFDPTAISYASSPKITRSMVRIGELELLATTNPDEYINKAIKNAQDVRSSTSSIKAEDFNKATRYSIDGFGSLHEYYSSGMVEILEFEGSMYDSYTEEMLDNHVITVIDRQFIARKEPLTAWKRGGLKNMTGWRKRPDNLYPMGPLDNLVGMQYRLDHLENAKADAWDLVINPAWKIRGSLADELDIYPNAEIHISEDGDIAPMSYPTEALSVNNEIGYLMQLMEEFAGAPREAMGIRSPGEKTMYEVQSLENAAGRIFQEKITQFEIEILETTLNNMLATSVQNLDGVDVTRIIDDDLGISSFMELTKEDITAEGNLRPVGARHFAQRAQALQNLTQTAASPLWPKIEPHFSGKQLAKFFEDTLQIGRNELVTDNISIVEQLETQRLVNQGQETLETEAMTPIDGEGAEEEEQMMQQQPPMGM